jgi:hypothetical protein
VRRYLFTSTRGVYAGFTSDPMDEDAPLGVSTVEADVTGETADGFDYTSACA